MSIEITTQLIHASYASVIRTIDENANIYDNPNQQGTYYPAWFIVHRSPVELQKGIGRWTLVYQIDIWYMLKSNQTRLYDQYSAIAEQLDDKLEYLPIFGTDACVHVLDRSWGLELDALKYSTTLRLYASRGPKPVIPYMEVIEDLRVFLKNMNIATVTFTNTTYPEFTIELPDPMATDKGDFIKLPYMSGAYEKDDETYVPYRWDIGEFGQNIQVNENMVANLEWKVAEIVTLVFTNTDYPEFDITLPDSVVALSNSEILLPEVIGEYEKDNKTYTPKAWTVGDFNTTFTILENTTTNLVWSVVETVTLSFSNTEYPEFDVDLPDNISVASGESVILPVVEGQYTKWGKVYTPKRWNIGEFGETIILTSNITTDLVWDEQQSSGIPESPLELVAPIAKIDGGVLSINDGFEVYQSQYIDDWLKPKIKSQDKFIIRTYAPMMKRLEPDT